MVICCIRDCIQYTWNNKQETDTHIPKGLEDVCSIFNRDCLQSSVRKSFCYRPRYIPCQACLSLQIGSPGCSTKSLAGNVFGIWPHIDICFAQQSHVIRPSRSMRMPVTSSAWLGMAGDCGRPWGGECSGEGGPGGNTSDFWLNRPSSSESSKAAQFHGKKWTCQIS